MCAAFLATALSDDVGVLDDNVEDIVPGRGVKGGGFALRRGDLPRAGAEGTDSVVAGGGADVVALGLEDLEDGARRSSKRAL